MEIRTDKRILISFMTKEDNFTIYKTYKKFYEYYKAKKSRKGKGNRDDGKGARAVFQVPSTRKYGLPRDEKPDSFNSKKRLKHKRK